jgi:hypothetical protein
MARLCNGRTRLSGNGDCARLYAPAKTARHTAVVRAEGCGEGYATDASVVWRLVGSRDVHAWGAGSSGLASDLTGWGRLHALSSGGAGLLENHVAGRTFEPADWAVDKLEIVILGLNR